MRLGRKVIPPTDPKKPWPREGIGGKTAPGWYVTCACGWEPPPDRQPASTRIDAEAAYAAHLTEGA